MSSGIFERPEYGSFVYIGEKSAYRSRACVDVIPIRFQWLKVYGNYNPDTQRHVLEEPILLRRKTLKLRFSRERVSENAKTKMERFATYKRVIERSPREANKLRNKLICYVCNQVGLSLYEHPNIIEQILSFLLEKAVPDRILEVKVANFIFRHTVESMSMLDFALEDEEYYRAKLIPASESFIQALEEMSSPPDDEELECAICMEMFAQKKDNSITQLPCSHYFHRHCIVPWLHINHVCPTCRRPYAPST